MSVAVTQRAVWLAQTNGARLTFVDIIDAHPGDISRLFSAVSEGRGAEVEGKVLDFHTTRLDDLTAPLVEQGLDVMARIVSGTNFIETIRLVLENDHDLVLKGAHRGPDKPFLRAPDLHLLRKCPCPVWILNGEVRAHAQRILAAVDPDPDDRIRDQLNHVVMQLATSLARNDAAKLDVINVWNIQEESTMRHGLVKIPEDEIQAVLDHEEAQSARRYQRLKAAYCDYADLMRPLHIKGIAADVIPEHVESESIDTLVMGTLGRTGISGFFIGNTAETILNRVSCSVLAVKPEGFVSPVRLDEREALS